MQTDGEEHPQATSGAEPLLTSLLLLPGRALFVAVALVQIGVELAVTALRGAPAGRND